MSLNRYAKKRDIAEPEIFLALRLMGFSVQPLDRPVDAIAGFRGRTFLLEIKTGKRKLNDNQKDFVEKWKGSEVVVLRTAQDAMDWGVQVASEMERGA